jgi:aminoglycoside phosphotransferase (APT) family kinase protein
MDEVFNQRLAGVAGVRVPQVYDVQTVDGRLGVIMERIDGTDLLTEVGRKPWRIYSIASRCGRTHAGLNSVLAPLPLTPAVERYRAIVERLEDIPGEMKVVALKRLATLPDGDSLCHLDFHPANVMEQNGKAVVIDWSNAARGPAEVDYARSMLILQLGDPPPGTALTLRILAVVGRRIFRALYSRAYRRILKLDDAQVRAWAVPVAVARLGDGIESEREALLSHIRSLLAAPTLSGSKA